MVTTLCFLSYALAAPDEVAPRTPDDVRLTAATGAALFVAGDALSRLEGVAYKPVRDVGTSASFSGVSMLLAAETARRSQLVDSGRSVSATWAYVGWGFTAGAATTSVTALVSTDPRTLRVASTALRWGGVVAALAQAGVNTRAARARADRVARVSEDAPFAWTVAPATTDETLGVSLSGTF
jgi:hypothetical protein